MMKSLGKRFAGFYDLVEQKYHGHVYRKKAKLRSKRMNGGYPCKKEYKEIVLPYWKQYGKKPGMIWYRLYSAETKKVDPRYIPDDMWFEDILPYFTTPRQLKDKCYDGVWFPEIRRPFTVVANVAGVFYDNEFRILTREEAARRCVEYKRFLIKPSIDSGEGRKIRFFDDQALTVEKMLEVFDSYEANFLAQQVVEQHPEISRLNNSSVNTVRLVTFLFQGEVHLLSAILRIGGSGSRVDNIGAGGYSCAILEHGKLNYRAVNRKSEWVEQTQDGIRFSDVTVPGFDLAVETVKKLHNRTAHYKLIGWDICIDKDAQPVLIEYNTGPGQNQYSCGPTFGDLTDRVLEDVFIKKTLKNS